MDLAISAHDMAVNCSIVAIDEEPNPRTCRGSGSPTRRLLWSDDGPNTSFARASPGGDRKTDYPLPPPKIRIPLTMLRGGDIPRRTGPMLLHLCFLTPCVDQHIMIHQPSIRSKNSLFSDNNRPPDSRHLFPLHFSPGGRSTARNG